MSNNTQTNDENQTQQQQPAYPVDYKCLLDVRTRQMTEEETRIMCMLMLSGPEQHAAMLEQVRERSMAGAIVCSRLPKEVEVAPSVLVFCASLCRTPGDAVMWAYTLSVAYWQHRQPVSMDHFATRMFPFGVPDSGGTVGQRAWEAQKGYNNNIECDNLLDVPAFWEAVRNHYAA